MATEQAVDVDAPASPPLASERRSPIDDGRRKRKASSPEARSDDGPVKRARPGSEDRASPPPRRRSPSPAYRRDSHGSGQERRPSVTQEDKKRGKRLFGGLLSTLSQAGSSSQQKRRQEIERRQQIKMKEQTAEDDKRRAEKKAELHKIRMEQQIHLEEQVMRNRHAKELRLAQFLCTRARPVIYYRPYRLSEREEDIIDDQISDVKVDIARDLEDFKYRKERHLRRYGLNKDTDSRPREQTPAAMPVPDIGPPPSPRPSANAEDVVPQPEKEDLDIRDAEPVEQGPAPQHSQHRDPHDDSGDVLVEGEEDMVIY
ncbi:hypothetical protein JDV02_000921 [Purpureocillium takamizusanense]|uniref:Pinin/SDK/MemA protein domain-containing protein n=1 Tax=Purpureocillium takamizusanense TaxID=2060973 RepID=A0A9Q8Q7U0_9HYPO|nr:uncharacterized protein JDV02_000921 [Purpureocillium takamizusanense]UNI14276.1 hypothetical protein JDV02_000921 [Purpureocillium takamizusanense]